MPQERLLTPQQVADRLNCSRNQVYLLIQQGDLTATRPAPRMIRVYESSVDELLEAGRSSAAS